MSRARKAAQGPSSLDLMEEVFHRLRRAPAIVWWVYYAGTLPFVLGLLYFWADMSRGAYAGDRLLGSALVMTGLFLWMKTCHCRFTAHLMARLCGQPTPAWRGLDWLEVTLKQALWQPLGLFILPLAILILAPLGWAYAFFQNMTVLGQPGAPSLFRRAWQQTLLWPGQNHTGLAALKGFALFVFLNWVLAALAIPQLLKLLLGIESSFTRLMTDSGALILTIFNTTFLSVVLCLTYLCVDPMLKMFYVLRCFYGESLRTGQDLQAELIRWRPQPALALFLGCCFLCLAQAPLPAATPPAANTAIEPAQLDRAIDDVLSARDYRWRLPRVSSDTENEKGFVQLTMESLVEMITDGLKTAGSWVRKAINFLTRGRWGGGLSTGPGWHAALRGILLLLAGLLVFLVVLFIVRTWRRRVSPSVQAEAILAPPDLSDENVGADHLPEDGWLEMARQLTAKGELRLALRAFYLASLAHLAGRQFISIAKFKSNREYQRELDRRAHALPRVSGLFAHNVTVFDGVWYGLHQVDETLLEQFSKNVEQIRHAT